MQCADVAGSLVVFLRSFLLLVQLHMRSTEKEIIPALAAVRPKDDPLVEDATKEFQVHFHPVFTLSHYHSVTLARLCACAFVRCAE